MKLTSRSIFSWTAVASMILVAGFAFHSCGGSAPGPVRGDSFTDDYASAKKHFDKEDWDKAKLAFEAVTFNYPGAANIDSAQFYLAMSNYNLKDFIVAADEFQRLRSRYPTSPLVDEADLLRCRALLRIAPKNAGLDQEKTREAITELNLFKDNHPLSPNRPAVDSLLAEAQGRLSKRDYRTATLYHRLGRYEAARIYFQQVIDNYTDSPRVPDCLFYMAESYRKLDSTDRAIEYYEKMAYLFPGHERVTQARKRISDLGRQRDTAQSGE